MPSGVGGSEGSAGLGGRTELKDPLDGLAVCDDVISTVEKCGTVEGRGAALCGAIWVWPS